MKKLDSLRWVPRWVSHLGCIKGCLDYLGISVSDAWLFGATGHAFVLNICGDLCPSGPTNWNTRMFLRLGRNIGYSIEGVFGWKGEQDLGELQERAWEHVRSAIDQDTPCYGWELDMPEYYAIYGYGEKGYYISGPGCDDGKGPVPWRKLGTSEIGVVEVLSVKQIQPSDDRKTIREALSYALEHAHRPEKYTDPHCYGGLEGYDAWIRSLENGRAAAFGLAFNTAVWAECRNYAVSFLKEAQDRIDDEEINILLEKAAGFFDITSQNLDAVKESYSFNPELSMDPIPVDDLSRSASSALRRAKEAEVDGFETIDKIVTLLSE